MFISKDVRMSVNKMKLIKRAARHNKNKAAHLIIGYKDGIYERFFFYRVSILWVNKRVREVYDMMRINTQEADEAICWH